MSGSAAGFKKKSAPAPLFIFPNIQPLHQSVVRADFEMPPAARKHTCQRRARNGTASPFDADMRCGNGPYDGARFSFQRLASALREGHQQFHSFETSCKCGGGAASAVSSVQATGRQRRAATPVQEVQSDNHEEDTDFDVASGAGSCAGGGCRLSDAVDCDGDYDGGCDSICGGDCGGDCGGNRDDCESDDGAGGAASAGDGGDRDAVGRLQQAGLTLAEIDRLESRLDIIAGQQPPPPRILKRIKGYFRSIRDWIGKFIERHNRKQLIGVGVLAAFAIVTAFFIPTIIPAAAQIVATAASHIPGPAQIVAAAAAASHMPGPAVGAAVVYGLLCASTTNS